jgi:hypothetical protein
VRLLEYLAAASYLALEVAMTVVFPSNRVSGGFVAKMTATARQVLPRDIGAQLPCSSPRSFRRSLNSPRFRLLNHPALSRVFHAKRRVQQRIMNFYFFRCADEPKFAEFVREVAHAGSGRSNHLR